MEKRFLYILILIGFCLPNHLFAQTSGGIYFNFTQPLNEYSANILNNPMGFSFNMLKQLPCEKLSVGAEFGVSMYATDSYKYEMLDGEYKGTIVDIDEEDCYLNFQAVARYRLNNDKFITPYFEGLVGATSFFSTRFTDQEIDDATVNVTQFHGTALRLGGGGGLLFRISDYVSVDLNVVANSGTKTDYRSVEPADATFRRTLEEGRKESTTSNLNFKLGFQFGF